MVAASPWPHEYRTHEPMKLPTPAKLAGLTGHGKRLTEYRLRGQRGVKASILLAYLDAIVDDDALDEERAAIALDLVEHFAALEGRLVLSFPPGNPQEDERQDVALASDAELRFGQMPGHGNAYQVLCSCPALAKSKGVVRTFNRRDQALGYWRHLRHLREQGAELLDGASGVLVDDEPPAQRPKSKAAKSKGKGGGSASKSKA